MQPNVSRCGVSTNLIINLCHANRFCFVAFFNGTLLPRLMWGAIGVIFMVFLSITPKSKLLKFFFYSYLRHSKLKGLKFSYYSILLTCISPGTAVSLPLSDFVHEIAFVCFSNCISLEKFHFMLFFRL